MHTQDTSPEPAGVPGRIPFPDLLEALTDNALAQRRRKKSRRTTAELGRALGAAATALPSGSREAVALNAHSARLLRCAAEDGWNCGSPICPACEVAKAKKHLKALIALMQATCLSEDRCAFLTFTAVAPTTPTDGFRALTEGMSQLRRLKMWRTAVRGGFYFLQVKPVLRRGVLTSWNVHSHGLFELAAPRCLDVPAVARRWQLLLSQRGPHLVGSVHNEPVYDLWNWGGQP